MGVLVLIDWYIFSGIFDTYYIRAKPDPFKNSRGKRFELDERLIGANHYIAFGHSPTKDHFYVISEKKGVIIEVKKFFLSRRIKNCGRQCSILIGANYYA